MRTFNLFKYRDVKKAKPMKLYELFEVMQPHEQLINHIKDRQLSSPERKYLAEKIYKEFPFDELIKLDELSRKNKQLELILNEIPSGPIHIINQGIVDELTYAESTLSTSYFMFFLIRKKKEYRYLNPHSVVLKKILNDVLANIDVKIIQNLAILKADLKTAVPFKESFGLFLIEDKETALQNFKKSIARYLASENNRSFIMMILTSFERVFRTINQDFIPYITDENYQGKEILNNNNSQFITKKELYKILEFPNVLEDHPLKSICAEDLLQPKTYIAKYPEFKENMERFFSTYLFPNEPSSESCEVFIQDITMPTGKYSSYQSKEVREKLLYAFRENKENLFKLLALFYEMQAADILVRSKGKLIKLLDTYIPDQIISKSTLWDHLMRDTDKTVFESRLQKIKEYRIEINQKIIHQYL